MEYQITRRLPKKILQLFKSNPELLVKYQSFDEGKTPESENVLQEYIWEKYQKESTDAIESFKVQTAIQAMLVAKASVFYLNGREGLHYQVDAAYDSWITETFVLRNMEKREYRKPILKGAKPISQ
jgi:hypothetical protein